MNKCIKVIGSQDYHYRKNGKTNIEWGKEEKTTRENELKLKELL